MFQILQDINVDWLGNRLWFIGVSVVLMLAGLGSAIFARQRAARHSISVLTFRRRPVVTARFKQRPNDEAIQ